MTAWSTEEASVQDVIGETKDRALDAGRRARGQAREAGDKARMRVREEVSQRSSMFGGQVASIASDLRMFGEGMRTQGREGIVPDIADQAADRLEQVAMYLSETDADQVLQDLQSFAEQRPWAVAGAFFGLGFAAARAIKAANAGGAGGGS